MSPATTRSQGACKPLLLLAFFASWAAACGGDPARPPLPPEDDLEGCQPDGSMQLAVVGYAHRTLQAGEQEPLAVMLKDSCRKPVADMSVTFEILGAAGASRLEVTQAYTMVDGTASTTLQAGDAAGSFQVWAHGPVDPQGVKFNVTVQSGTAECDSDDDCPGGYVCEQGVCRPDDGLPDSCETSADCPEGHYCQGHECYPCPENSDLPECGGTPDPCANVECPPGTVCRDGLCVDPDEVDPVPPELGGTWYSSYHFDTGQAVEGLTSMQGILDTLNELVNHCELTDIDWVDQLICDNFVTYVPDWAGDLIDIFANLSHILSDLRARGVMHVTHQDPRNRVAVTEEWTRILLSYPQACCLGRPEGCNPYNQPDYPQCATVDITREELAFGQVGIEVQPFTARVEADRSGSATAFDLVVEPRSVRIEYAQFVAYVVELLVRIATDYPTLDAALQDIIDCNGVQDFVDGVLGEYTVDVRGTCESFKPSAGELLRGLLNQIGFDWKLLRFEGRATIATTGDDPPYGVALGTVDHEQNQDGSCQGTFKVIVDGDVPGTWYAQR